MLYEIISSSICIMGVFLLAFLLEKPLGRKITPEKQRSKAERWFLVLLLGVFSGFLIFMTAQLLNAYYHLW